MIKHTLNTHLSQAYNSRVGTSSAVYSLGRLTGFMVRKGKFVILILINSVNSANQNRMKLVEQLLYTDLSMSCWLKAEMLLAATMLAVLSLLICVGSQ